MYLAYISRTLNPFPLLLASSWGSSYILDLPAYFYPPHTWGSIYLLFLTITSPPYPPLQGGVITSQITYFLYFIYLLTSFTYLLTYACPLGGPLLSPYLLACSLDPTIISPTAMHCPLRRPLPPQGHLLPLLSPLLPYLPPSLHGGHVTPQSLSYESAK